MQRYKRKFAPIKLLSREQIEMLHRGTVQILENVGVVFQSRRALEFCKRADAALTTTPGW